MKHVQAVTTPGGFHYQATVMFQLKHVQAVTKLVWQGELGIQVSIEACSSSNVFHQFIVSTRTEFQLKHVQAVTILFAS